MRSRKLIYLGITILILGAFLGWKNIQINFQNKTSAEISNYIVSRMSFCRQNDNMNQCYKTNAEDFLNRFKLADIMKVFDQKEKTPEFFEKCHLTAHFLGQNAYKKYGSVAKVFAEASHSCLGGVYHGAVEGYFMAQGITDFESKKIKEDIGRLCGTAKDYNDPQKFIECDHGLGHATMYLTKNDLPKALDLCDALPSINERNLCYTGALMANGDSFGSTDHPTKYIKASDPMYPCPILKKLQQEQCYTYGVLTRFQSDLSKSISICRAVPAEFQHQCFETIGRDRTMLSSDPVELKSQCYQIKKEEWRSACISGTSYNLVIRFGADSNIPADYCNITDSKYKGGCYSRIVVAVKNLIKDKPALQRFCERISDDNYKNQCLNSI